jgi:tight adherence protein B
VGLAVAGIVAGQVVFPGRNPSIGLALLGFVPWLYVNGRANRRLAKFEAQLPDALDLLTRALRAGQSLTAGFRMVSDELPDPIGFEFAQVADQVQLGHDMPAALNDFAYRIQSRSVPFLVTAIVIQRETGSNLAEVLQKLADVIRERFRFYGKVSALTAMGRFSANILAVWPVVMVGVVYVVNPAYITPLWETDEGIRMIMLCVPMVIIGYLLCRRMAVVEV